MIFLIFHLSIFQTYIKSVSLAAYTFQYAKYTTPTKKAFLFNSNKIDFHSAHNRLQLGKLLSDIYSKERKDTRTTPARNFLHCRCNNTKRRIALLGGSPTARRNLITLRTIYYIRTGIQEQDTSSPAQSILGNGGKDGSAPKKECSSWFRKV